MSIADRTPARYTPPEPGTVVPVAQLGYFVASFTTPGRWYLMDGQGCSCPATAESCRHIRAVSAYVRKLDASRRRPTAPPNISALVDQMPSGWNIVGGVPKAGFVGEETRPVRVHEPLRTAPSLAGGNAAREGSTQGRMFLVQHRLGLHARIVEKEGDHAHV